MDLVSRRTNRRSDEVGPIVDEQGTLGGDDNLQKLQTTDVQDGSAERRRNFVWTAVGVGRARLRMTCSGRRVSL